MSSSITGVKMRRQGCKPQTTTETPGTLILRLLDKVTKEKKKKGCACRIQGDKSELESPNVGWDQ